MNNLFLKIIKAGLLVGTLDILAAFIHYIIVSGKSNPLIVLKFIASGIFGNEAFSDGNIMIIAGLILHYIIALGFTLFFFWLFPKLNLLSKNKILTGITYGIFIWLIMNIVVVPLSHTPDQPFDVVSAFINVVILVVCIGIPLSLMANSFYKKVNKKPVK